MLFSPSTYLSILVHATGLKRRSIIPFEPNA
jgi:hypothetical protein